MPPKSPPDELATTPSRVILDGDISRLEQLEQRITELDTAELMELRTWFERYDAEIWDCQIEIDSKNSKLRPFIYTAGQGTSLWSSDGAPAC